MQPRAAVGGKSCARSSSATRDDVPDLDAVPPPTLAVRMRQRLVAPDGTAIVPTSKPQPDGTVVKALARAWRWQRMLDEGVYASVSDIGDAENISKSYVSRILRLALLAPDIIEAILVGRADQSLMLERLERPLAGELGGTTQPPRLVNRREE